ncbi:dTDP-4-dehydrorhamnose 3,5-epimerase [Sneathiella chinensis]|uniref:dTDP-4-dehydrorhamnose 3,5-epimerase n=1 Tax=Sneathiella chinensis TaxID=349750 RepID=A0ABQ5U4P5_9PROT|nr:dTDP-4-dehydrorhamnose 3,5-epimerase [Sneathiella chinensis]GLQ06297.1 dTDP-4-dehydrorhamnose 3,5-epimerase [Sneathiella chinensis]
MLQIEATSLPDVKIVTPRKFGDERGFFSEVWNRDAMSEAGIEADFVQDNHAYSAAKGTIRGLHYQMDPKAQGKLVRVTRGTVLDVAVDIRRGSPTFGKYAAVTLSVDNWRQLWIPAGFAHGYCTLTDEVEFLYKVTERYSPEQERGIRWDDPDIAINWQIPPEQITVSDKDRILPYLAEQPDLFD